MIIGRSRSMVQRAADDGDLRQYVPDFLVRDDDAVCGSTETLSKFAWNTSRNPGNLTISTPTPRTPEYLESHEPCCPGRRVAVEVPELAKTTALGAPYGGSDPCR